jgi:CheY-specific phosphatase CheX
MRMTNAIDSALVRDFLEAVIKALRATVGVDAVVATIGEIGARPPPTIAVVMNISGDIRGPVTWVFPPPVALELVRRLIDDPDPSPETANDGATELANILTGRAAAALETAGFRCEMGPPRIHEGLLPPGIAARLATVSGPIDVVLSLS